MADHQELIANFVGVVGSTPEQAQFYLEANNWDINVKFLQLTSALAWRFEGNKKTTRVMRLKCQFYTWCLLIF